MEQLPQQQAILALGKKIVEELKSDGIPNTIDLWLAHYVAEKITLVELEQDPQKRNHLENECVDLVLKIWRRRFKTSNRLNPLFRLEDTLEILESFVLKSFDFYRYQDDRPSGKYADISDSIHSSFIHIVDALTALSMLPVQFSTIKSWAENAPKLLTADEQKLVSNLTYTLMRALDKAGIVVDKIEDIENNGQQANYESLIFENIIVFLKELVDKTERLKNAMGNASDDVVTIT